MGGGAAWGGQLDQAGVESDLYAAGAMLFELLKGERFRSHCKTEDALLCDIFEGGVPELQRADVPEDLRWLLRELLSVSWQQRPHSAAEVVKRIGISRRVVRQAVNAWRGAKTSVDDAGL